MRVSPIINPAMWIFVVGFFIGQTAIGDDVYLELKKGVQEGMRIQLVGGKKPTVKLESKTGEKSLNEKETLEWVCHIAKSPGLKKDIEAYDWSQEYIFEKLSSIYRRHEYPESLCENMQEFYIRHLISPDKRLQNMAFCYLGTTMKKELESLPEELFLKVLAFAKEHPTYGMSDSSNTLFCNIIFRIGCCGKRPESIGWLKSIAGKYPDYEASRKVALIRLGEKGYEKEFISAYYKSPAGCTKYNLALALGLASSEETLKVLASELRNNEVWNESGFNQRVLFALTRSKEWTIKLSNSTSFEQEDFDKAEEWCQKRFGTTWNIPKPPARKMKWISVGPKQSDRKLVDPPTSPPKPKSSPSPKSDIKTPTPAPK